MSDKPNISVVVPVFNEEGSVGVLHQRLCAALAALGRSFELLFVDDGSTDGSPAILDDLARDDERVTVLHFATNFGKAAALSAGFAHARGDVTITMDADLQDDPDEIGALLAKLEEGYDVVSGWKASRKDPWHKTLPSKLFNAVVGRVFGLPLHDFNCGFKVYRTHALQCLELYGELHRYIPVLLAQRGYRVGEMPVRHHPRRHGRSKYGVERLAKGFFDLLTVLLNTRYRSRPLHMFGFAGATLGALGFLVLSYLTVLWFLGHRPIGDRPLLLLGLLLVVVGVQLVSTGLLGEMIALTRHDRRADYVLRQNQPSAPQQDGPLPPFSDATGRSAHDGLRAIICAPKPPTAPASSGPERRPRP